MATEVTSLGFEPSYSAVLAPEFPGDGTWRVPVHQFEQHDQERRNRAPFETSGCVVKFRTHEGTEWVGFFDALDWGDLRVLACPSSTACLVVSKGIGFYFDVREPDQYEVIHLLPVRGVERVTGTEMLVLWDWTVMVGIARDAIAWRTKGLCLDNLELRSASAAGIACSGQIPPDYGVMRDFTLDPLSGLIVDGSEYQGP